MRRRDANNSQSQRRKKSQKTKKKLQSPIDINPRKPYILIINRTKGNKIMSNLNNEMILEDLFEQFIEEGHDDDTAEALARETFENQAHQE